MDAGHHSAVGVEVESGGFGQGGEDVQLGQSFDQHNGGGEEDLGAADVEVALQVRASSLLTGRAAVVAPVVPLSVARSTMTERTGATAAMCGLWVVRMSDGPVRSRYRKRCRWSVT